MLQQSLFDLFNINKPETKEEKKEKKKRRKNSSVLEQIDLFSLNIPREKEEIKENRKEGESKLKTIVINAVETLTSLFRTNKDLLDYKLSKRNFKEDLSIKEKFTANIIAIKTLKRIEAENRLADSKEQSIIAKYYGWGGLAKAFDKNDKSWNKEYELLKNTLTEEEYSSARRSSTTAFYTPISVIRFIYSVIDRLGFEGGKILDPSAGIGYYQGIMPDSMRELSKVDCIELDSLSSRIAKQLYQNMHIINSGYEKTKLKDDSYDLIISNIPFGDITMYDEQDKDLNKLNLFIHDYYFAKSLRKVREGGIIAFITSSGTMDKTNTKIREILSEETNLIGAVRLPYNTFKQLSNTEVTTDILFLQKTTNNHKNTWLNVAKLNDEITINEYYITHPYMMLGEMTLKSCQYGFTQICKAQKDFDLDKSILSLIKYFPSDVYTARDNDYYMYEEEDLLDSSPYPNLKEGGYEIIKEKIFQKQGERLLPCDLKGKNYSIVKALIELKKHVLLMIDEQIAGCSDIRLKELQGTLSKLYSSFSFYYGIINGKDVEKAFSEDPDYYLLCSLENKNSDGIYEKGAFFTERTISSTKHITHVDSVKDGLLVSLNMKGYIDLEYIAQLYDSSKEKVTKELLSIGLIYLNPGTENYELRQDYLSGNVRKKLVIAKEAVKNNPMYEPNVAALEKIIPEFVYDVYMQLGSTWIPEWVIQKFIVGLLKISIPSQLTVSYNSYLSLWRIERDKRLFISNSTLSVEYGTSRINAIKLINDTLNLKDVEIYDTYLDDEGKEKRKLNPKETQFARQKQDSIKREFGNFIENDDNGNTKKLLLKLYNETFNSTVERRFDGQFLELPGINPNITLRPHQKNAIERILFSKQNCLLAHSVGTGKTWTMQASCMELVRLGLAKKILFVVPNSLVRSGQFAKEFLTLYPAARLLIATGKDFSKKNRRKFITKIATNNYDAVIMGHSSFKMISLSAKTQQEFYNKQVEEISEVIELLSKDDDKFLIKRLEKRKQNLLNKAQKLLDVKRDATLEFEKLGIDYLMIDEAHNFKNLYVYTANLAGISGVPTQVSEKAMDMYMKISFLNRKYNNKAVCFATGTPISNSMAEMYNTMKYLMENVLQERGFSTFDSWASTFGEVVSALEVTPTGKGFRANKRFAKFNNVPELMKLFREVADIVLTNDVKMDLPSLKSGKPIIEKILPTEKMKNYVDGLVERAEKIYKGEVSIYEDNMLSVTNDGRMMAVDPRLVGLPSNSILDTPKLDRLCENVYKEWLLGNSKRLTQLIFSDLGTPTGKSFNFYKAIRTRLAEMGIPEEEIKFIHEGNTDEKRNKLMEDFKEGKVRILIGSTSKCGEGVNLQDKLVALHNVDCPWRPSDVEQREGRIIRQNNQNMEVSIYRYVVKSSFDAYSWQTIERKSTYISQVMSGKTEIRSVEDITEKTLSYQETKAIACDNPIVMKKFEVDNEIQKLMLLKKAYSEQKSRISYKIDSSKNNLKEAQEYVLSLQKDMKKLDSYTPKTEEEFEIKIGEEIITERVAAGEQLLKEISSNTVIGEEENRKVGELKDFDIKYIKRQQYIGEEYDKYVAIQGNDYIYRIDISLSALGNITKLENIVKSFGAKLSDKEEYVNRLQHEIINLEAQTKLSFTEEEHLTSLLKEQSKIDTELSVHEGIIGAGVDAEEESTDEIA